MDLMKEIQETEGKDKQKKSNEPLKLSLIKDGINYPSKRRETEYLIVLLDGYSDETRITRENLEVNVSVPSQKRKVTSITEVKPFNGRMTYDSPKWSGDKLREKVIADKNSEKPMNEKFMMGVEKNIPCYVLEITANVENGDTLESDTIEPNDYAIFNFNFGDALGWNSVAVGSAFQGLFKEVIKKGKHKGKRKTEASILKYSANSNGYSLTYEEQMDEELMAKVEELRAKLPEIYSEFSEVLPEPYIDWFERTYQKKFYSKLDLWKADKNDVTLDFSLSDDRKKELGLNTSEAEPTEKELVTAGNTDESESFDKPPF